MNVSVVRVPVSQLAEGYSDHHAEAGWRGGCVMFGQKVYRHSRGEMKDEAMGIGTSIFLRPGIHTGLFSDDKLVIVDSDRINIVAKSVTQIPCKTARASKFGLLIEDGKAISLITEIKSFPRATLLVDDLYIALIFGHDRKIHQLFDVSLGELLYVSSGGLESTYLLNATGCEVIVEDNNVSYVNDDIALHRCAKRGVFAIDLRNPDKAHFISEIQPWTYIPSHVGITYVAKVMAPPIDFVAPGGGEFQIITITRKVPERCTVCAAGGPLVRVALSCGHIVRIHERCADVVVIKCTCECLSDRSIMLCD